MEKTPGLPGDSLAVPVYRGPEEKDDPQIAAFPEAPEGPTILAWSSIEKLAEELGEEQLWVGIRTEALRELAKNNGYALKVDQSVGDINKP